MTISSGKNIFLIGHFRNIYIQLDTEAERTKQKKQVAMNVKDIIISSTFLCLCPLNLSFNLNFNISKKAYYLNFSLNLESERQN